MSLSRLNLLRQRLAAAIRRHGLMTVIKVVLGALFRQGLVATLRLGGSHRPFPWDRRPQVSATERRLPADLDESYSLDEKSWAEWRGLVGAARPRPEDGDAPAQLIFVVSRVDGDVDSAALDRTKAAVRALGPQASLWPEAPEAGAGARFIVFVQAGDEPEADMPLCIGRAARGGVAEVVTFDLVGRDGECVRPLLFPGANPTLLRSADYTFSRLALAEGLLSDAPNLQAVDPRRQVLAWLEGRPAAQARGRWRHASRPLLTIRLDGEAIERQRRDVLQASRAPAADYRGEPVSVVICTKDKGRLTRQLVNHLLREDPALVGEVVIVSNNTANAHALASLEDLGRSPRVKVLRRDEPFNFSKLCNAGARHGDGRGPLLFLNDDIAPVSEDWLRRLAVRLHDPDVGSVGPLLLYPDERVQHAGVYLGFKGGAGHVLRGARLPEEDYLLTGSAAREVSAVTGAVLLTPRRTFEALNGFDEQLALAFQDVDYGLRTMHVGQVNIFEPASVLLHMESVSVSSLGVSQEVLRRRQAERMRFLARWGDDFLRNDPLHPRGFDIEDETLRRLSGSARPRRAQRA